MKTLISLYFDSKIPEILQCHKKTKQNKKISSTHSLPSSPQKNPFTSQTTSKNTFFFSVNRSLET